MCKLQPDTFNLARHIMAEFTYETGAAPKLMAVTQH